MHIASFLPALWIGSCLASKWVCVGSGQQFDRARHALVGRTADLMTACLEAHGCCYDSQERDSDPEYYTCQAKTGCHAEHNPCNPNPKSGYATC
ncbi:unnamed protein product [Zymoseptoria tritici ST99CH_1A5]|uniref:Uncharacterized protein n=1 Tax=Zymoseptoria tritici ST99CH_1A5 TaxID=1276529 RepID=A0A1Y6L2A1_ZYMTR|nr:unnamed protein product [Zymoseptoria tritici ST99CH_1A5]